MIQDVSLRKRWGVVTRPIYEVWGQAIDGCLGLVTRLTAQSVAFSLHLGLGMLYYWTYDIVARRHRHVQWLVSPGNLT